jgi:hypothetical protein
MSLLGQQFIQRLGLLFMPVKNQPDFAWLRTVRMHRVHLFTFIQALSVLGLLVIRYASEVAMGFPALVCFFWLIPFLSTHFLSPFCNRFFVCREHFLIVRWLQAKNH